MPDINFCKPEDILSSLKEEAEELRKAANRSKESLFSLTKSILDNLIAMGMGYATQKALEQLDKLIEEYAVDKIIQSVSGLVYALIMSSKYAKLFFYDIMLQGVKYQISDRIDVANEIIDNIITIESFIEKYTPPYAISSETEKMASALELLIQADNKLKKIEEEFNKTGRYYYQGFYGAKNNIEAAYNIYAARSGGPLSNIETWEQLTDEAKKQWEIIVNDADNVYKAIINIAVKIPIAYAGITELVGGLSGIAAYMGAFGKATVDRYKENKVEYENSTEGVINNNTATLNKTIVQTQENSPSDTRGVISGKSESAGKRIETPNVKSDKFFKSTADVLKWVNTALMQKNIAFLNTRIRSSINQINTFDTNFEKYYDNNKFFINNDLSYLKNELEDLIDDMKPEDTKLFPEIVAGAKNISYSGRIKALIIQAESLKTFTTQSEFLETNEDYLADILNMLSQYPEDGQYYLEEEFMTNSLKTLLNMLLIFVRSNGKDKAMAELGIMKMHLSKSVSYDSNLLNTINKFDIINAILGEVDDFSGSMEQFMKQKVGLEKEYEKFKKTLEDIMAFMNNTLGMGIAAASNVASIIQYGDIVSSIKNTTLNLTLCPNSRVPVKPTDEIGKDEDEILEEVIIKEDFKKLKETETRAVTLRKSREAMARNNWEYANMAREVLEP